jgi:hypothetical protein
MTTKTTITEVPKAEEGELTMVSIKARNRLIPEGFPPQRLSPPSFILPMVSKRDKLSI